MTCSHLSGDEVRLADHARSRAPNQLLHSWSLMTHDAVAVLGDRQPPELRPHAERGVHVVGRPRHRDALDAVVRAQRGGAAAEHEDAVDELRALLVVEVELQAEAEALGQVRARRGAGQDDQPVGVGEGERPQEDRVDDAEHPGHRADGERERADGGDEKAGRAKQRAPGMAEVRRPLHDPVHSLLESHILTELPG